MKKFLFLILTFSFLFMTIAPVFSFAANAPFVVNTDFTKSELEDISANASFIVASSSSDAFLYYVKISSGSLISAELSIHPTNDSPRLVLRRQADNLNTFYVYTTLISLIDGNITSRLGTFTPSSNDYWFSTQPSNFFDSGLTWYAFSFPCSGAISGSIDSSINSSSDFVIWRLPTASEKIVRSYLDKPNSNFGYSYIADRKYLYQFSTDLGLVYYNSISGYSQQGNPPYTNYSFDTMEYYGMIPYIENLSSNQIKFTYYNMSTETRNIYIYKYDVVSGQLISNYMTTQSPTSVFTYNITINDMFDYGIWTSGVIMKNSLANVPMLPISWSDTIDYSSDFSAIISLLNNLYSQLTTLNIRVSDIKDYIQLIFEQDGDHYYWLRNNFFNTITGKWDLTNYKLDQIINILSDSSITTIPVDESYSDEVDSYVSEEHSMMDNAASGIEDLSLQFNDVDSIFDLFSDGFTLIRYCWAFVFDGPSAYVFLISAIFGVVLTIIGKRMASG